MTNPIDAHRIVARYLEKTGMEHATPEALKTYLHAHPGADPKNHTVKKPSGGGGGKSTDSGAADAEATKSSARSVDTSKSFDEMKGLRQKVDNADPAAKKKFDRAYDKLYDGGDAAAKAGEKLLKKYENAGEGLEGDAKKEAESAVELVRRAVSDWKSNHNDHARAQGAPTSKKMQQAEQTHAYAEQLEGTLRGLSKALKG